MSSLKFAVLCVLTAYLLVVAFNFITKLRDARLMQKLLCMLFPISQICLIAFPLACSARYGLSAAVYVSLIVLGIACGPVTCCCSVRSTRRADGSIRPAR